MGSKFTKRSIKCDCVLSHKYNHCCKECFQAIENAQEMKDILYLRWIMTAKHEHALNASLRRYECEYLLPIILCFLPSIKNSKLLPTKAFGADDTDSEYHAYFHCNVSPLCCRHNALCPIWMNAHSMKYQEKYPQFKLVMLGDGGVGKSAMAIRYITNNFLEEYGITKCI